MKEEKSTPSLWSWKIRDVLYMSGTRVMRNWIWFCSCLNIYLLSQLHISCTNPRPPIWTIFINCHLSILYMHAYICIYYICIWCVIWNGHQVAVVFKVCFSFFSVDKCMYKGHRKLQRFSERFFLKSCCEDLCPYIELLRKSFLQLWNKSWSVYGNRTFQLLCARALTISVLTYHISLHAGQFWKVSRELSIRTSLRQLTLPDTVYCVSWWHSVLCRTFF